MGNARRTQFNIVSYDPLVPVEVIEVAGLNETEIPDEFAGQDIRDEPFRLLFMALQNVDIPQGVYALVHDEMDPKIMLLVPIDLPRLTAIINWNWKRSLHKPIGEILIGTRSVSKRQRRLLPSADFGFRCKSNPRGYLPALACQHRSVLTAEQARK